MPTTSNKKPDSDLDHLQGLADEADEAKRAADGVPPSGDANEPGAESAEKTDQAETPPGVDPEDAREVSEMVCEGLAAFVHELFPIVAYPPETIEKATDKLTPLVMKYGPRLVSGEGGGAVSLVAVLREYKLEIGAGWFFFKVFKETMITVRQAKAEQAARQAEAEPEQEPAPQVAKGTVYESEAAADGA